MKNFLALVFLSLLILSFTKKKEEYTIINQDSKFKESIKRGKEIYIDMCTSCHMANGEGIPKVYPPLAKSDYLMEKRQASIRAIKYGLRGKIVVNGITYKNMMSRLGLLDDEVADVMNYITNSWENKNQKMITVEEVKAILKN